MLVYASAAILVGFVAVVWGADRFVFGAAGIASNLGVGRLAIGLSIVAFGTSAPEMLVSGMAAWAGSPQMGIGNAIGSNITNTTLVLGAAAIVRPLRVNSRLLIRELPVLLGIMAIAWFFLRDDSLSRVEGGVLLAGMFALVAWIAIQAKVQGADEADPLTAGIEDEIPDPMPSAKGVFLFVVGLFFLLVGSRVLVWGAVGVAENLGVSQLVIGLTVVALGTSLPELAASVAAARRNEQDIAVGSVVGSNMFNLLGVLSLPGLIAPGAKVSHALVTRDFPIMFGVTVLLIVMAATGRDPHIGRKRGSLLILLFSAYFLMLFYPAS
ncbi:MAG: calcium/sodium antiporter [Myxococcota bacterium]